MAGLVAIAFGGALAAPAADPAPRSVAHPLRTMGTWATVTLVAPDSASSAAEAARAHRALARVDSLMSNWTATSEVARLNREGGSGATPVHPEVAHVLDAALRVGHASGGAFDVTVEPLVRAWGFLGGPKRVPADAEIAAAFERVGLRHVRFDAAARTLSFARPGVKIDLGGIAKGYGVDVAAESLRAAGVRDALIDVSGNLRALGHPPGAARWRLGVRDPHDRVPYFARLTLADGEAIATSGKYEQFVAAGGQTYGHIMDPRTGRPADGLIAVTVLAPTAMEADAWGTALFVLGAEDGKRVARERDDIDAILVERGSDGVDVVWVEPSLRDRFVLESHAASWFRVEYF